MSAYEAILRSLNAAADRRIVSDDGLANAALRDLTGIDDSAMISRALWRLEQDGLVKRDVKGRRCHAIALTKTGITRAKQLPDTTTIEPAAIQPATSQPAKKRAPKPARPGKPQQRSLSPEADQVLSFLAGLPNNRITDVDGRMNSVLRNKLSIEDPLAVTRALTVLEKRGLIHRVLHGKRCPLLELTDAGRVLLNIEPVAPRAKDDEPAAEEPVPSATPTVSASSPSTVSPSTVSPSTVSTQRERTPTTANNAPASTTVVDVEFATAVANQLLTLVVAKVNAPDDTALLTSLRAELARTVEACEEAEQRALTAERQLPLLRAEVETWKTRCDRLEKNLEAVMNGPDRSRAAYDRARELTKIISSRPHSNSR